MKLFFKCNLFENKHFKISDKFFVDQNQLILKKIKNNGEVIFKKEKALYSCTWQKQDNFSIEKPTLIVPTKDMPDLLTKTIKNLENNSLTDHCNLIIVDDRSEEDIKSIVGKYSYLSVKYDKGFNFSMLNNIAAFICYNLGCKQIVMWNNDLWNVNNSYFLELLSRHNKNNSTISGSKLVYPPKNLSFLQEEDSKNIIDYFPNMSGKWRETIQYGGTMFIFSNSNIQSAIPIHYKRFANPLNPTVNCDKGTECLTGALMIIELQDFIEVGGLNPSLAKNFQDTDLCLKIYEKGKNIFYFGKDIFFYHDESVTLTGKKKNDNQMLNDQVLFEKIWNEKLPSLIF